MAGTEPDVVVVGGGAAGLAAATTARAGGLSVVLVAAGPLGGDCTWHGCVPSKALLEAAAAGLGAGDAVAHARACVERVARLESPTVLGAAGVEVVRDRVVLRTGGAVPEVVGTDRRWRPGRGVVLATGSRPVAAPAWVPGGVRSTTTDGWLDALDAHLHTSGERAAVAVVGAGPGGVELAQALGRLGLAVTLHERAEWVLPGLPPAVGEALGRVLTADGVDVRTAAVTPSVPADALVLLATGRRPVVPPLEDVGHPEGATLLVRDDGAVAVDDALRTSVPGLLAAGDVTGLQPTTHVAAAHGRRAAATLLGVSVPEAGAVRWAPRVVWTDPEVAAVGDLDGPRHARVPLSRVDRALLAGVGGRRPTGWVEVWADADLRLRGALLVGPRAGELVAEAALVGRLGLTVPEWVAGAEGLGGTSPHHAYPSWSWVWREATDRLLGR
ncbi:FAD-dependent oxidoreductase [Aquipuribacter nitratireducens]|uniref:FAD-dependent oxidoreductase n=1 Tax=Aquipuribacter nitratireducens TaxID=650104 RepID=A0ABW0GPH1_9MICO